MCISNSRFTFDVSRFNFDVHFTTLHLKKVHVSRFNFDVHFTTLHLKKVHGYITFEEGARLQMLHLKKVHGCVKMPSRTPNKEYICRLCFFDLVACDQSWIPQTPAITSVPRRLQESGWQVLVIALAASMTLSMYSVLSRT
jgi:hypothetical protein